MGEDTVKADRMLRRFCAAALGDDGVAGECEAGARAGRGRGGASWA